MSESVAVVVERGRRGKVSRLPVVLREEINRKLRDGISAREICSWLNDVPSCREVVDREFDGVAVSEENLSRWRSGGYLSWERRQEALEAIATLGEESFSIQDSVKEGLANRIATVLCAQLAVQVKRLEELPDGPERANVWRELLFGLVLLRRGDLQSERLKAEKERFEFKRFRGPAEMEAAFLKWAGTKENREKVLGALLPALGSGKAAKKAAHKATVTAVKNALGIR
jgi:hypothetical protein